MPYIKQEDRDSLWNTREPATAGELNYAITCLMRDYLLRNGGTTYQLINDCVGALEGAKAEFQRRIVAPYEDWKRIENGDVYYKENK